jgi:enoyl-CoA hydratase
VTDVVHIEDAGGGVRVLRFDRPPANAIDLPTAERLGEAIPGVLEDAGTRALVITGRPGFFSAGLDLKAVPAYGPDRQRAMVDAINRLLLRVYAAPVPVVAAVSGHAIAGGLVLALACDWRVGARGAFRLGLTESRVAVPYPFAAMTVVRSELAPAASRALVLVGRNVDPEAALGLGVLDELAAAEALRERALAVAADLAATPREGYARVKRQLRGEAIARIEACIEQGSDPLLASWLGSETASAASDMLHRRGGA